MTTTRFTVHCIGHGLTRPILLKEIAGVCELYNAIKCVITSLLYNHVCAHNPVFATSRMTHQGQSIIFF